MEEEKEIKEADIIDDEKKEARLKKGIDFRLELALFLILGFLLGVVIKTEAVKRITIGFNDGSIPSQRQAYDFEKIKKEIAEQSAAAQQTAPASDANNQ
ncbi:MAG: hypothetical protein WC906_02500 [Parcubacteria group bacterium]|jgi:hypothetical protein